MLIGRRQQFRNQLQRHFVRRFPDAGVVDQNLAHGTRRYTKEVVLIQDAGFQPVQFQEQLTDEGGRLQGVSRAFPTEQGGGDNSEAVKCESVYRIPGDAVSPPCLLKQGCKCLSHGPEFLPRVCV